MEIKNYFLLLRRYKYLLITVPILTIIAARFLVHYLPDTYIAKTQIMTGVVDQSQHVINNNDQPRDQQASQFSNIMETMQLDKVMYQVSYQLTLHDLTSPKPFRESKQLEALSSSSKAQIASLIRNKQQTFELLNPAIPAEHNIDSLIEGLRYDPDQLLKKNLKIFHNDGSDYISVEGESENADLSSMMVNQLSGQFIRYYTSNLNRGHSKSTEFLKNLLAEKQSAMKNKIAELQDYKVKHGILDVANESKDVYSQVGELETNREQAQKDVIAYAGALKGINGRFDPKDRRYVEAASSKVNNSILNAREQLRVLNDKYVENNFDPKYKKSIDSIQNAMNSHISESADRFIANPLASKENLVQEKLKMENSLELAKYSVSSLDKQIGTLKGRMSGLVPAQAVLTSLERDVDVATKEYLDVQDKYNQASVANILPVQLSQLHAAMPGAKQPGKKLLLVLLSGVVSFVLCLVILLVVFYFDESVRNGDDLRRITDLPILGQLNYVPGLMNNASNQKNLGTNMKVFKEMLREIRFEIDNELTGQKVLGVTSLGGSQGKTLFSFSLAYAYAMANQKVLLIDGNFNNPTISETVQTKLFLEDYFKTTDSIANGDTYIMANILDSAQQTRLLEINNESGIGATLQHLNKQTPVEEDSLGKISVLGNKGGDTSLLEISSRALITERMEMLRAKFDVIIIETGSLDVLSASKEWMAFADKTIAVFETNQSITHQSKKSIKYLNSLNGKMLGWILNKVSVQNLKPANA